jgi:hypothetical protein
VTTPQQTREQRAAQVVALARAGELGQDGTDLVALFTEAVKRGGRAEQLADDERRKREGVEREANALAAVLADVLHTAASGRLDVAKLDELIAPVPSDARRRVLAYRHRLSVWAGAARALDQYGPLPDVPPRASVLRESVRTIDG